MPHLSRADAIVVGAGPAGSACAALLARGGWRTVLIDAGEFPRHKVCGECLGESALPVLESLHVARQLVTSGAALDHLDIVLPDDRRLSLPLAGQSMLAVSRFRLDSALLQQAVACGVQVLCDWRVSDVRIERRRAVGVVVSPVRSSAAAESITAPLVIAADGRSSAVVRKTGRVRRQGPALVGMKRHFRLDDRSRLAAGRLEMHGLASGYLGVCRVEEGIVNVCGVTPRGLVRTARGSIETALQQLLPPDSSAARLLADAEPVSPWLTISDVSRQTATPHVAGVLYLGDALGTIEPLTGQGMSMALLSAQQAAVRLLAGNPGSVDAAFQQEYAAAWQRAFGRARRCGALLGWLLRHPRTLSTIATATHWPVALQTQLVRAAFGTTRIAQPR